MVCICINLWHLHKRNREGKSDQVFQIYLFLIFFYVFGRYFNTLYFGVTSKLYIIRINELSKRILSCIIYCWYRLYLLLENVIKKTWVYYSLILLTIPSVFIPGGRGGAILLILYFILYIIIITFRKNVNAFIKLFIYVIGLASFVTLVYYIVTSAGESRTFQYITSNGIDIQNGSSGRAPIYQMSTYFICQRPIFGYGPFNYYHLIHNIPHNIILELLLSFGIVGLMTILILLIITTINFIKNYDANSIDLLVVFIVVYPLTLLMFSTNYLVVSELWFVMFYMITKRKRLNNYGKKELHNR